MVRSLHSSEHLAIPLDGFRTLIFSKACPGLRDVEYRVCLLRSKVQLIILHLERVHRCHKSIGFKFVRHY